MDHYSNIPSSAERAADELVKRHATWARAEVMWAEQRKLANDEVAAWEEVLVIAAGRAAARESLERSHKWKKAWDAAVQKENEAQAALEAAREAAWAERDE